MGIRDKKWVYAASIALVAVGMLLGWLFFGRSAPHDHVNQDQMEETVWTCSMHPHIRMTEPGKCPICGMDLIPLQSLQATGEDSIDVKMSATAMQLANVQTAIVKRVEPHKTTSLFGRVVADERLLFSQSTHVSGRVEQLLVSSTGEMVQKGQILAYVYSPDLIIAQDELLRALELVSEQPELFEAAKGKLLNWKLNQDQIDDIVRSKTIQEQFPIAADETGVILRKMVNLGDYITKGQSLYEVADLSKVWVLFDLYERDAQWVKKGDVVHFEMQSYPGKEFKGRISFIDPVINPQTRVQTARVEMRNEDAKFIPEMFVSGVVESTIRLNGKQIVVPQSAVLWTGVRSLVYLKHSMASSFGFRLREVTLGPFLGDSYVIEEGLEEGEEIVVNGAFSIDAAAQLAGKPSMMNSAKKHVHPLSDKAGASIETQRFKVYGNCSMCKENIENSLKGKEGIVFVDWNIKSKMITVNYEPTHISLKAIKQNIALAGYDTDDVRATDEAYDSLATCCHYDRAQ